LIDQEILNGGIIPIAKHGPAIFSQRHGELTLKIGDLWDSDSGKKVLIYGGLTRLR
jgi:hypothetical protein